MASPLVSIIVTTFNIEQYVENCLASVLAQSLRDIEIIIVDDGSKDTTPDIIRRLAGTDNRIHTILLPANSIGGVSTAANAGLDIATGEYVGFADGDDIYEPRMFQKLYDAAKRYEADISICDYDDFDSQTNEISPSSDQNVWLRLPDDPVFVVGPKNIRVFLELSPVPWRKLYRREVLRQKKIRFPVVDYFFEDNPFHWKVLTECNTIVMVREILCHHRLNRVGQTMSPTSGRAITMLNHFVGLRDISNNSRYDLSLDLIGWLLRHIYWVYENVPARYYGDLFKIVKKHLNGITRNQVRSCIKNALFSERDGLLLLLIKQGRNHEARRILGGKSTKRFWLDIQLLSVFGPTAFARRRRELRNRALRKRIERVESRLRDSELRQRANDLRIEVLERLSGGHTDLELPSVYRD